MRSNFAAYLCSVLPTRSLRIMRRLWTVSLLRVWCLLFWHETPCCARLPKHFCLSICCALLLAAGVKRLSVSELNELLEEIETAIKEYSEELVQQLALRDELEFEKEVKNSFISVLIEVQNKQKEHKETAKKKKKLKNGSSQNGKNERSHMPGTVSGVLQESLSTWKLLPWWSQRSRPQAGRRRLRMRVLLTAAPTGSGGECHCAQQFQKGVLWVRTQWFSGYG